MSYTTRERRAEQWAENQGVIVVCVPTHNPDSRYAMLNCGGEPTVMMYGNKFWLREQLARRKYKLVEAPATFHSDDRNT
jgi:hypothetical protein